MDDHPRRGDVFFAFLDPVLGCEQGGTRPVLVVQNDAGNRRSKTIIVAAITGKPKANLPVHVPVPASAGLREGSVALLEQLRTIDKLRLRGRAGHIGAEQMRLVDAALAVSLGSKGRETTSCCSRCAGSAIRRSATRTTTWCGARTSSRSNASPAPSAIPARATTTRS